MSEKQYNVIVFWQDQEERLKMMYNMPRYMPTEHGNPHRWSYAIENQEPFGEYFVLRALDRETADKFRNTVKFNIQNGWLKDLIVLPVRETERDGTHIGEYVSKMKATLVLQD